MSLLLLFSGAVSAYQPVDEHYQQFKDPPGYLKRALTAAVVATTAVSFVPNAPFTPTPTQFGAFTQWQAPPPIITPKRYQISAAAMATSWLPITPLAVGGATAKPLAHIRWQVPQQLRNRQATQLTTAVIATTWQPAWLAQIPRAGTPAALGY